MTQIAGFGIGLRASYASQLVDWAASKDGQADAIDWLEIVPENWLYYGGKRRAMFEACRARWPMVSHSVSLNVGGTGPFDDEFLKLVDDFNQATHAPFWSDHICWSSVEQRPIHDLIPMPMNEATVAHLKARTAELKTKVHGDLVLENATFYVNMPGSTLSEAAFLKRVYEACDIGMLLDVNNVYVNSLNHGFDPRAMIDQLPLQRVRQIHLAGHTAEGDVVIDTHIGPTPEPVWDLYKHTLERLGRLPPTLVEWDQEVPELSVMVGELERARAVAKSAGVL